VKFVSVLDDTYDGVRRFKRMKQRGELSRYCEQTLRERPIPVGLWAVVIGNYSPQDVHSKRREETFGSIEDVDVDELDGYRNLMRNELGEAQVRQAHRPRLRISV
jgi:hypothetical protein